MGAGEGGFILMFERKQGALSVLFSVTLFATQVYAQSPQKTQCAISPLAAYEILTYQAKQKQIRKTNQLVNINTASVAELTQLPKIGVKKAQAIVNYRLNQGVFTSVDDLTQIKGIGQKTVDDFRHRLTIQ